MDYREIIVSILALVIAFTVHEYAHARAAFQAGDETAKENGRLTLNPLAHLDPLGTIMFVFMIVNGFGIGWGKPVPVNPQRFRDPRWDNLRVSLWGPLSNLILAVLFSILFRTTIIAVRMGFLHHSLAQSVLILFLMFCAVAVETNVCLAVFNLLPIPPLDGSHILASLLPVESARKFEWAAGRYGFAILFILLYTHVLGKVISTPISMLTTLLIPPLR